MTSNPGTPAITRRENLALLYQGLLTGIVRIHSGRQPLVNADMFRRRTKEALAEVTREAMKRGYAADHTMETDFAVVAFLDEVILTSKDPARDAWAQRPLQEELFNVSTAGELFFTRIERLQQRADTPELADMLKLAAMAAGGFALFILLAAWVHLFFKGSSLHDLLVKALVM